MAQAFSPKNKLVIIGGGAAGVFTAINAAEKWQARSETYAITILEAGASPLQKVRISGGGRCNVTHKCFDPKLLLTYYPRGQKELPALFSRFQPSDMVTWLKRHGLHLKTEADGRMFPIENTSEAVIDCFLKTARQLGVEIRLRQRVIAVEKNQNGFLIQTADGSVLADKLVLATGYSQPGWHLAKTLGHQIIPPVPSLFPFKTAPSCLDDLAGISLQHAAGKLSVKPPEIHGVSAKPLRFESAGPFLITHQGVSGPLIYRLSALGAKALADASYQAQLLLDLLPDYSDEEVLALLKNNVQVEQGKKQLKNTQFPGLANRLWLALLDSAEVPMDALPQVLSHKLLNRLVERLKRLPLTVIAKSPSKEEFVSCGGVSLKEVDFKGMQSKRCPNLFLVGEILNIDGLTGGFNFQACWSAAWTASEGITAVSE
ncbi:MAG: NAD(P)/FAD-dependent oxidoreductase [Vampirovibrionales bacterium]|nr:NAD(P)/FAD-dependent oxidoreductase [Vampirovibrionales bacterium]